MLLKSLPLVIRTWLTCYEIYFLRFAFRISTPLNLVVAKIKFNSISDYRNLVKRSWLWFACLYACGT